MENVIIRYLDEKDKAITELKTEIENLKRQPVKIESVREEDKIFKEEFERKFIESNKFHIKEINIENVHDYHYLELQKELLLKGFTNLNFIRDFILNMVKNVKESEKND